MEAALLRGLLPAIAGNSALLQAPLWQVYKRCLSSSAAASSLQQQQQQGGASSSGSADASQASTRGDSGTTTSSTTSSSTSGDSSQWAIKRVFKISSHPPQQRGAPPPREVMDSLRALDLPDTRRRALQPWDLGSREVTMRTRIVLAAMRSLEEPLSSPELYSYVRERFPACGITSRHHFKQLLERLKENAWVKARPGPKGQAYRLHVTDTGLGVPLEDVPEARHAVMARARAAEIVEGLVEQGGRGEAREGSGGRGRSRWPRR